MSDKSHVIIFIVWLILFISILAYVITKCQELSQEGRE